MKHDYEKVLEKCNPLTYEDAYHVFKYHGESIRHALRLAAALVREPSEGVRSAAAQAMSDYADKYSLNITELADDVQSLISFMRQPIMRPHGVPENAITVADVVQNLLLVIKQQAEALEFYARCDVAGKATAITGPGGFAYFDRDDGKRARVALAASAPLVKLVEGV